jgi:hypothetical protein
MGVSPSYAEYPMAGRRVNGGYSRTTLHEPKPLPWCYRVDPIVLLAVVGAMVGLVVGFVAAIVWLG